MILRIRIFVNRKILILGIFLRKMAILRKILRIRLILRIRIFVNTGPGQTHSDEWQALTQNIQTLLALTQSKDKYP